MSQLTDVSLFSQFLNHDCARLMSSLTPATGIICYEVDEIANPVGFCLHGVNRNFHHEYKNYFQQIDPLHPRLFDEGDSHVLSIHELFAQEIWQCRFYTDHLQPYGYEEIIDLHFRRDGKIIAGMTLFFDAENSEYYRHKADKLMALHQFIENSLSKLMHMDMNQKLVQFCDHFLLTKKERKVLHHVLQGMENKVIADNLYCSLSTIKTHLQNIFNKLAVNSKAEAVTLFLNTLH